MVSAISALSSYELSYIKKLKNTYNTQNTQSVSSTDSTSETQTTNSTQNTQNTQAAQSSAAGGASQVDNAIKEEAIELAGKIGAYVSSEDELTVIFDAIEEAIQELEQEAEHDPQKLAQLQIYKDEYESLCNTDSGTTQLQNSLSAMATYNIAALNTTKK